ncbi:MAG: DegQ family serine endoprotease [Alphaproteobacteria bacterium]|nr:DegQ family serine endoprotease [Alphaproteobacteria bacterium]
MLRIVTVFLIFILGTNSSFAQQRFMPRDRQEITMSFAPLVKRTAPAVVNVYAKTIEKQRAQGGPFDDPIFRQLFGLGNDYGPPRERVANSLGSGVIVDPSGIIVTNNHVIKNGTDIRVALADKREFQAKIILADERTDLAVLKIDVKDENLPSLTMGNSDDLEVGDLVLAIGDPFGVGQTVTSGIVSALARNSVGASDYQFFIQTDAAINPGNSGGALVNMRGELIGINTAIVTRSGGSVGIGFSIPSNMVQTVVNSAAKGTKIVRPWMGGSFQDVSQDIADSLGFARPEGALIVDLHPQSPLAKAGLQRGDVVVALDGKLIENAQEFSYFVATAKLGDRKLVEYRRGPLTRQASIKMIAAPETIQRALTRITGQTPLAGLVVANLSPAVADEVSLPAEATGVVVLDVQQGPAQQFFQKGDIILEVNGEAIDTVETLRKSLQQQAGRRWQVAFMRGGRKAYLRLG